MWRDDERLYARRRARARGANDGDSEMNYDEARKTAEFDQVRAANDTIAQLVNDRLCALRE